MKLNTDQDLIEQIELDEPSGRRNKAMLILMPAKVLPQPLFIGNAQTGTIEGNESESSPGFGRKALIENLVCAEEEIFEKGGFD